MIMESLYLKPEQVFEPTEQETMTKQSFASKLGDAHELWPQEILDLFYEQHPYLADSEVEPVFKQINPERGYAIGTIVTKRKPATIPRDVEAGEMTKEIRFPFVVRDKDVSTFDIFVVGESFHPATEKNIEQALFRPETFEVVTHLPGDISLVNQLYPPYRSRYGFGTSFESGAGGKFSSVAMLDQIAPFMSKEDIERVTSSLADDPSMRQQLQLSPAFRSSIQKISEIETLSLADLREARRQAIPSDVVQLTREGFNVRVKSANSQMFSPREEIITLKEAVAVMPPETKTQFLEEGSSTISTDPVVRENFDEEKAFIIKNFGVYDIMQKVDRDTSPSRAIVYTSVVDFDMMTLPVTLAIFFHNGNWSFQDRIAGKACTDLEIPAFIKKAPAVRSLLPRDYRPVTNPERSHDQIPEELAMPKLGTVVFASVNGVSTIPVTIKSATVKPDGVILHGITAMNKSVTLIPSSIAKAIQKVDESTYLLPLGLKVIYLGPKLVESARESSEYLKMASADSVEIISDGSTFSFRNHPCLRKLGTDAQFLDRQAALFLAASLGLSVPFADETLEKAAYLKEPIKVRGIRSIVTEAEKLASIRLEVIEEIRPIAKVKILLVKEAAALPDEDTVDKVLSLNFITPENASIFHRNLPGFVMTASKLAELLIGVRLGLKDIPEVVVQRSMNALQGVIEALSQLRYNQARPT
jgi:hypothetical protein